MVDKKEIEMLIGGAVRDNRDSPPLDLKRERWVKNTLRQVYVSQEEQVVKCFFHHPGRRDFRKPWDQEDRALRALKGLNVPETYGYRKIRTADGTPGVIYTKQYIKGVTLDRATADVAASMGELLAGFHNRGVATLDPAIHNFVRSPDGQLYFIDFGRARIYPGKGPVFQVMVGKEFFRIFREAFIWDHDLLRHFKSAYRRHRPEKNGGENWLVKKSFSYWKKRYKRKYPNGQ